MHVQIYNTGRCFFVCRGTYSAQPLPPMEWGGGSCLVFVNNTIFSSFFFSLQHLFSICTKTYIFQLAFFWQRTSEGFQTSTFVGFWYYCPDARGPGPCHEQPLPEACMGASHALVRRSPCFPPGPALEPWATPWPRLAPWVPRPLAGLKMLRARDE